jgi:hypothetical protein
MDVEVSKEQFFDSAQHATTLFLSVRLPTRKSSVYVGPRNHHSV